MYKMCPGYRTQPGGLSNTLHVKELGELVQQPAVQAVVELHEVIDVIDTEKHMSSSA
jgi:hypothetical protein